MLVEIVDLRSGDKFKGTGGQTDVIRDSRPCPSHPKTHTLVNKEDCWWNGSKVQIIPKKEED